MFHRRCGPFPDYASLSAFYNRKLDKTKGSTGDTIRSAQPDTEPFDESRPLVFTHGGISMRNVIFGRDGRIWVSNWNLSGFYPQWFEYVSTVYAAKRDNAPDLWNYLIPFIADPYFKHVKWMDTLKPFLTNRTNTAKKFPIQSRSVSGVAF